jgi:NAD(P)-dependent dehydrogenase (short-subunit alcohol dehydrogenase family)
MIEPAPDEKFEGRHLGKSSGRTTRILVTGASGLLGAKIVQTAIDRGHNVFSSYKEHPFTNRKPAQLDQTHESQVRETIARNTSSIGSAELCLILA